MNLNNQIAKFKLYNWIVFLSIVTITGCQRGCTFNKIIKRTNKVVNVKGIPVNIKILLNKATRLKRQSRELFDVKSTSSYYVIVKVEIDEEDYELTYIPAEKDEILEPYLERVSLSASDNAYYMVVAFDEKITHLFQKLGKLYGRSPYAKTYKGKTVSQMKFSELPNEEEFIDDVINYRVSVVKFNVNKRVDSSFVEYIKSKNFDEEDTKTLFKKWPDEVLSRAYFDFERVNQIKNKYKSWRKIAEAKTRNFLKDNYTASQESITHYISLFLMLSKKEEIQKMDASLVNDWGKVFKNKATEYYLERLRLKNKLKIPIKEDYIKQIEAKCIKNLRVYPEKLAFRDEDKLEDISKIIEFLLLAGNKNEVHKSIKRLFTVTNYQKDKYAIDRVVKNQYDIFPTNTQKEILKFYEKTFYKISQENNVKANSNDFQNGIRPMDVAEVYNFLKDKVSCEKLKTLKNHYKDKFDDNDLVFLEESKRCNF